MKGNKDHRRSCFWPRILVRIMGLLLVALAVPFFVNGLTDLGLMAKTA